LSRNDYFGYWQTPPSCPYRLLQRDVMDEIIVELTSSFIMTDLGIAHAPRAEHAAYIASWLQA
jgi:antirestriction protein ArdC